LIADTLFEIDATSNHRMTTKTKLAGPMHRGDVESILSRADPKLGRVIDAVVERTGIQTPQRSKAPPFEALVRAIVYQRMAAQAAATIYRNLKQSVSGGFTPKKVLLLPLRQLRTAGLSATKAQYVRNLADWFAAHPATAQKLAALPDEAVIEVLTSIAGVGLWTVNVFLIFSLQRPDIVPTSDLGIRRGVQLALGLEGLPTSQLVCDRALRWRPYRSIACVYLWNSVRLKLAPEDLRKRRRP
jgi:DNA-3-methyladenine glycosylase II